MKRLSFLFSFLLAVLLVPTGQAQDLSVHTLTNPGQGGVRSTIMNWTMGAGVTYHAEPVGVSASVLTSNTRTTASAGPSFRLSGGDTSLDLITSAVYTKGTHRLSGALARKPALGARLALRAGTKPLSMTIGIQHVGSGYGYYGPGRWYEGSVQWYDTRFERTSAIIGFGVAL